jgi:PAS domain S-box-containing protein
MEISESLSRYQAIFEAAIDGIITIDREGVIQSVNPSAARIFGYEKEEMLGRNVSILMPSPDRERHDQYIRNYLETGVGKIIGIGREVVGEKRDGTLFHFRLSISEVKMDNLHIFTGIVHDITEIKEAEEKLSQLNAELEKKVEERTNQLTEAANKLLKTNTKLQSQIEQRLKTEKALLESQKELQLALEKEKELGELKSKFVTIASHEFRTPLSTILSSSSLIAKYTDSETQAKREKHINRIKNSVNNLVNILNDLLSIGKIEEGKTEVKPEEFDLVELMDEITGQMQESAKEGQLIKLKSDWKKKEVRLDQHLLKNICLNLVSNAIKYSPEGSVIDLCLCDEGDVFIFKVVDKGIGIPEEEQKNLFERFFRANNVTNIQGTGLGLSIVKSYAELMGGEVRCESILDEGTTFFVKLPYKNLAHESQHRAH